MITDNDTPTISIGEDFATAMKAWEDGNTIEARRLARRLAGS